MDSVVLSDVKTRQHKILSNNAAALILLTLWAFGMSLASGKLFSIVGEHVLDAFGREFSENGQKIITIWGQIIWCVLCLFIHKLWFKGEFKGNFAPFNYKNNEVLVTMLAVFFISKIPDFITYTQGFTPPSLLTLSVSIGVGVQTEVGFRIIPLSVLMRNDKKEDHLQLWCILTSIICGLYQFTYLLQGEVLAVVFIRFYMALSMGYFLGAVYIRTGNAAYPMIFRALFMFVVLIEPVFNGLEISNSKVLGILNMISIFFMGGIYIAGGIWLLRSSKKAHIIHVWKKIWTRG